MESWARLGRIIIESPSFIISTAVWAWLVDCLRCLNAPTIDSHINSPSGVFCAAAAAVFLIRLAVGSSFSLLVLLFLCVFLLIFSVHCSTHSPTYTLIVCVCVCGSPFRLWRGADEKGKIKRRKEAFSSSFSSSHLICSSCQSPASPRTKCILLSARLCSSLSFQALCWWNACVFRPFFSFLFGSLHPCLSSHFSFLWPSHFHYYYDFVQGKAPPLLFYLFK